MQNLPLQPADCLQGSFMTHVNQDNDVNKPTVLNTQVSMTTPGCVTARSPW